MRIALYCPNKPLNHPNPSGDLIIARGIHKALNQLGHECREIVHFRSRWFWTSPAGWAQAASALLHAFRKTLAFRPDLWLTYHTYYKAPDVVGPWVSRFHRIPYVLFQPIFSTRRRKARDTRWGFRLNRFALLSADHAFTNNLDDVEALERILPFDKITYLAPGIFPEMFERDERCRTIIRSRYGISEQVPLLLTAARFRADVKFESLAYLLRSLARLKSERLPFSLLIIGDGPMEAPLRRMAEALLPGQVFFAGRIERSAMACHYSAADLFVFPGIGESLGMVFLEAQACGLPVVALDTTGVFQVVRHHETGLLVPWDNGEAFAEAVKMLLTHVEMRERFAAAGPVYIREARNLWISYEQLAKAMEAIVERRRGKRT